jgi:hypothetical protein
MGGKTCVWMRDHGGEPLDIVGDRLRARFDAVTLRPYRLFDASPEM